MIQNPLIKNWIEIAIQQPVDNELEMFYYDATNKEFFSILLLDLYLFDKNLNLLEGISLYYSKAELKLLKDRVQRIFKQKTSIITLPKYGIIEEDQQKNKCIEAFITEHKIDIHNATVYIQFQKEPLQQLSKKTKPWWKIW